MTAASNNAPVNAPAPAPVQTAIAITQAPSEVVVNREIAIAGTADFTQVLQILVTLANDAPVAVQLNATTGTWQVKITAGLPTAMATFLRVRAIGANNQLLAELIVNILVKNPDISLITKQATRFKASPADSGTLPPNGKVDVLAGQTLEVLRYGSVDGHIKVLLKQQIAPMGAFGYFYAPPCGFACTDYANGEARHDFQDFYSGFAVFALYPKSRGESRDKIVVRWEFYDRC